MARRFSLQLVLDLAERRAEEKAREVKRAHGEWLRARGHQTRLLTIRDARVRELTGQLRQGLAASQLHERSRLLHLHETELQLAAARIESTYLVWQQKLAAWLQLQQRVKALKVLEQRHLDARGVELRRMEQRQHDELSQHARFWRRDARRG